MLGVTLHRFDKQREKFTSREVDVRDYQGSVTNIKSRRGGLTCVRMEAQELQGKCNLLICIIGRRKTNPIVSDYREN